MKRTRSRACSTEPAAVVGAEGQCWEEVEIGGEAGWLPRQSTPTVEF